MLGSSVPVKFGTIWASGAAPQFIRTPIPVPSQQGSAPGRASFTDGYPPVNFLPEGGGGIPPFGDDVNGIFSMISAWIQFLGAGGAFIPKFDAAYAASIGGYPQSAIVQSNSGIGVANFWFNTVDNNTGDPDAGAPNWSPVNLLGGFTTGDVKLTLKTVADLGWVMMNDGTLGNATSGANTASAGTANLFALLYNNTTDSNCPLFTSGGAGTTRGAQGTAATAFANSCRISLPLALGRALAGAGAGSGLTSRALASTFGEENHLLSSGEMPSHNHTGSGNVSDPGHTHTLNDTSGSGGIVTGTTGSIRNPGSNNGGVFTTLSIAPALTGITVPSLNINPTGGGGSHNNVQPSVYLNVMIKL